MHTKRAFIKSCALVLAAALLVTGAQAKSCLWKVSSGSGTLYLQGSVHVLKAGNYPLAPAIEQAYAASDALVLEVNMQEMTAPETQQRIMAKAMLPGTETLQQALTAETYQKLSSKCAEAGIPIAALDKFKPWFATMTLTLFKMQTLGLDPQYGLDKYFFDKATADAKPVVGLESVGFQIDLFDSLSESNPNDMVTHALADLELIETDMKKLDTAWINGDIDTLGSLIASGFDDYPELYKTFVTDRNQRWQQELDALLKKPGTHLIVVGAGHLPGKGGLLELLKDKGFTLEQM